MWYTPLFDTLEGMRDPERAAEKAAYMRDQFPFLGIVTPALKAACKPYFIVQKKAGTLDWGFVDTCWAKAEREYQYAVNIYLDMMAAFLVPEDMEKLRLLITTKSWWDTVDSLDQVAGALSFQYPPCKKVLLQWSVDENFWLRRVAIDHQLLRKEKMDIPLLEQILINNLGQTEFFINKAIGWALRDYSKTNPDWVRTFIHTHRESMAPLSIREGSKYL
jgi:3-methyladenine DNA glycosylase AlkD